MNAVCRNVFARQLGAALLVAVTLLGTIVGQVALAEHYSDASLPGQAPLATVVENLLVSS